MSFTQWCSLIQCLSALSDITELKVLSREFSTSTKKENISTVSEKKGFSILSLKEPTEWQER